MPVYDPRQANMVEQLFGSMKPEDESVFDSGTKKTIRTVLRLLGYDTPEGQVAQAVSPAPIIGPAALGVAAGGGRALPGLKARGAAAIRRLTKNPKLLGEEVPVAIAGGRVVTKQAAHQTLNREELEALQYAQKRWPRLFGHLEGIEATDSPKNFGALGPGWQYPLNDTDKISTLKLNPALHKAVNLPEFTMPDTVGHELLHAADRIAMPEKSLKPGDIGFFERYAKSIAREPDPAVGYRRSIYEIRARRQGQNMAQEMELNRLVNKSSGVDLPAKERAGQQILRKKRVAEAIRDKAYREENLP